LQYDDTKIVEAILAVLLLTALEEYGATRAWKSVDWEAMERLHMQGFIDDPTGRAKSIIFSEAGLARAKAAAEKLFAQGPARR
jgi:hypothetical protein